MDSHLEELSESFVDFTFVMPDGEIITTVPVRKGDFLDGDPDPKELDGYVFIGWFEKDSHKELAYCPAEEAATFVAEYLEEGSAVIPEALYFRRYEAWCQVGDFYNFGTESVILPENVSYGKIRWTSSNPDVVSVNQKGEAETVGIGEALITGTLYNGISKACLVHAYNPSTTKRETASGVQAEPEATTLAPGETIQVLGILTPEDRPLYDMDISINSEDPTVAEVRSYGPAGRVWLVTGVREGTTSLTIEAQDFDEGEKLTAKCTVIVTGFRLPTALTTIENQAFLGTAPNRVVIPKTVTSIGSEAFAENSELYKVIVYARSLTIAPDAFEDCPNLTVSGYTGTAIESYCKERNIPFQPIE